MGTKTMEKNEVGNRYGLLTVLRRYPGSMTGATWVCRCDCGTEVAVLGRSLRSGSVRSCGCYRQMSREEMIATGLKPHGKERVLREED